MRANRLALPLLPSALLPSALLLSVLVGCVADAGSQSLAISGGTRETGEPAVVLIQGVVGLCTGTLITDRVVLTAKHCVQPRGASDPMPASFFVVGMGDRSGATTALRVQSILTTPGGFFGTAITDGTDIALMILRTPVEGVEPIAVYRESPSSLVGQDVTAVGFGNTPMREVGIKYRTTATIQTVTGQVLTGENSICQGDSGGPIILEGPTRYVVGVASYGAGETCPSPLNAWNRVDIEMALIDRAILRSGGCLEPSDETCNSIDDDCDGGVDEGCAALGAACGTDAECANGPLPEGIGDGSEVTVRCTESVCALPCDARSPSTSCRAIPHPFGGEPTPLADFFCAQVDGCQGVCAPGRPGTGGNASECTADTDCASLRCADLGSVRRCVTTCEGDSLSCPSSEACSTSAAGSCGLCASLSSVPVARGRGEACDSAAQCASGVCEEAAGARICTLACTNDGGCGSGMHCADGFCARGARSAAGEACRGDSDCLVGLPCVTRGETSFCGFRCTEDRECGTGSCVEVGDARVCVPADPLVGEACTDTCAEGVCFEGTCRAPCGGGSACPIGYECARELGPALCRVASSGGGCSVLALGGGRSTLPLALASLALAISVARRRRTRTRDRR